MMLVREDEEIPRTNDSCQHLRTVCYRGDCDGLDRVPELVRDGRIAMGG